VNDFVDQHSPGGTLVVIALQQKFTPSSSQCILMAGGGVPGMAAWRALRQPGIESVVI